MTRSVLHRVKDGTRVSQPQEFEPFEFAPEPAPCDCCPYAITCRTRQLACRVFVQYIRTGRWKRQLTPRLPSRGPYLRLFRADLMAHQKRIHSLTESHGRPVRWRATDGRPTHPLAGG